MPNTLSKIFTLSIVFSIFLYGCTPPTVIEKQSDSSTHIISASEAQKNAINSNLNEEFILIPGQRAIINPANVSIYFAAVESDSRCPSDVQCIVAGTVKIIVEVTSMDDVSNNNSLSLNIGKSQSLSNNYNLEFIKIEPERGKQSQQITKSDYRATLKLTTVGEEE